MIAIIAILAALLLPALAAAHEKALRTACMNNLKQMGIVLESYSSDFNDFIPTWIGSSVSDWALGYVFRAMIAGGRDLNEREKTLKTCTRCGLGLLLASVLAVAAAAQADKDRPKNIIVMISDGCGYNHIAATGLYCDGRADSAVYHTFDVKLAVSTFPVNGGYDPAKAWEKFDYVRPKWTDSAAAATALATGVKTTNGILGMNRAFEPVPNVVECAEKLGKATGVVTSVIFSHATPAGFVAHKRGRGDYIYIAREMLLESEVDLIMSCGHPFYDGDGKPRDPAKLNSYEDFKFVGGRKVWNLLQEGKAGAEVDADHNGVADDAWTFIETREQFQALATGPVPKRLIGVARAQETLQNERSGDNDLRDDLPYQVPLTETVPTLVEMTKGALNVLDDDPDGFFLMIEGGAVDYTGHRNQSGRLIEEQRDFDKSVEAVVEWVAANSSWAETLVIVTSDHETGYLTVRKSQAVPVPWAHLPLMVRKAGEMPAMQWNSGDHTNSLVPLFAKGAGADRLPPRVVAKDPKRGPYIDNTAIAQVVFELWK